MFTGPTLGSIVTPSKERFSQLCLIISSKSRRRPGSRTRILRQEKKWKFKSLGGVERYKFRGVILGTRELGAKKKKAGVPLCRFHNHEPGSKVKRVVGPEGRAGRGGQKWGE